MLNNEGPIAFLLYLILIYCKVLLCLKYISQFLAYSLFEITFQVTYLLNLPQRQGTDPKNKDNI